MSLQDPPFFVVSMDEVELASLERVRVRSRIAIFCAYRRCFFASDHGNLLLRTDWAKDVRHGVCHEGLQCYTRSCGFHPDDTNRRHQEFPHVCPAPNFVPFLIIFSPSSHNFSRSEMGIVYFEGPQVLAWPSILKVVRSADDWEPWSKSGWESFMDLDVRVIWIGHSSVVPELFLILSWLTCVE